MLAQRHETVAITGGKQSVSYCLAMVIYFISGTLRYYKGGLEGPPVTAYEALNLLRQRKGTNEFIFAYIH